MKDRRVVYPMGNVRLAGDGGEHDLQYVLTNAARLGRLAVAGPVDVISMHVELPDLSPFPVELMPMNRSLLDSNEDAPAIAAFEWFYVFAPIMVIPACSRLVLRVLDQSSWMQRFPWWSVRSTWPFFGRVDTWATALCHVIESTEGW